MTVTETVTKCTFSLTNTSGIQVGAYLNITHHVIWGLEMLVLRKWGQNRAASVVLYDTYYTVLRSSLYFLANTPGICKQDCSFAKLLHVWSIEHYLISYKQNERWVIQQRGLEESGCEIMEILSFAWSDWWKPRKTSVCACHDPS
jgi:hypothetical protein